MIPLSLRAFKGEGERRIEAERMCKPHAPASNSVLGEWEVIQFGVSLLVLSVGVWEGRRWKTHLER